MFWYVAVRYGMLRGSGSNSSLTPCSSCGLQWTIFATTIIRWSLHAALAITLKGQAWRSIFAESFLRFYKIERMVLTFEFCPWRPLVTHDLEKKSHRIARIVGWDEPLAPTREWSICALSTAYIYLTFP